jgi:hypothetical protein
MIFNLFGSCRINRVIGNNQLNNLITYTHSTKEVIQLIRFLKGELSIPEPYNRYCFRTAITEKTNIDYCEDFKKTFTNSKICVIEICSRKKYFHNGFYLHHLSIYDGDEHAEHTPVDIKNTYEIQTQSDEEIEDDILEIQKMVYPQKVVIISHYNSKLDGEYLKSRHELIQLLENICKTHSIPFFNPTEAMSEYPQEKIIDPGLNHYTNLGLNAITKHLNLFLKGEIVKMMS